MSPRGKPNSNQAKWKFILVQVGPDRYREIFHLQAFYSVISIAPSRIIKSGNERVLATMDPNGGNGGFCWEGYWWFDPSGPHPLDFSRLQAAVRARVPKNTFFNISCEGLDLNSGEAESWVQRSDARCHACGLVGHVVARFQLKGANVQPVEVRFTRGGPPGLR